MLNDGRELMIVKLLNVAANRYRLTLVNLLCVHAPFQFSRYLMVFVKEQVSENPVCRNSKQWYTLVQ